MKRKWRNRDLRICNDTKKSLCTLAHITDGLCCVWEMKPVITILKFKLTFEQSGIKLDGGGGRLGEPLSLLNSYPNFLCILLAIGLGSKRQYLPHRHSCCMCREGREEEGERRERGGREEEGERREGGRGRGRGREEEREERKGQGRGREVGRETINTHCIPQCMHMVQCR